MVQFEFNDKQQFVKYLSNFKIEIRKVSTPLSYLDSFATNPATLITRAK